MEHSSKTRLMSAVVIAVVFGAGLLIGFAADSRLEADPSDTTIEVAESGEDETPRRTPMYAQLEPSPEQQATIDSIIAVHRARTNALDKETRKAYQDGFRVILLETRAAIKDVFPADKAAEYQRLLDEWDARPDEERGDQRRNRPN